MTGEMQQEARARIARLVRGIRLRIGLSAFLVTLPIVLAATAIAALFASLPTVVMVGVALLALTLVLAAWRARLFGPGWLARRLDATVPELEDSADLLVATEGADGTTNRSGLQRLQRARMQARFTRLTLPDLRPAFPRRWLLGTWIAALLAVAIAVYAPPWWSRVSRVAAAPDATQTETTTRLVEVGLDVTPPSYTRLSADRISTLDAKVPVGSRIAWTLELAPQPAGVTLVFHDGTRLSLRLDGEVWRGERVIDASTLYRLAVDGPTLAGSDRLNRIDAVPDHAPEIVVRAPEKTLSVLTQSKRTWDLAFEARDDYGLGTAELSISLAQGSGEQIAVTERKLVLDGGREPHARSYRKSLDLAALGFAQGDDLIVRLSVVDNHEPEPNRTSSASFILRWQPEASGESAGMDGLVQKVMPAYFRSQRQIIVDTEALLAERETLDEKHFGARSDDLGVDERALRLRYGQFLGEESEGGELKHEHEGAGEETEPDRVPAGFGEEGDAAEQYGHIHDLPDAATMLDPETQRILRAALNEMWHAELHLRQAHTDAALPFEYKALDYIKQVQQAERIYLARVGLELPHVDAARRLSGDRAGLADRTLDLPGGVAEPSPIPAAWQAIGSGGAPDLARLDAWARQQQDALPDALGLLAAIDSLRRDPACIACRSALQARLWSLLPAPATSVIPRAAPDAAGAAYLDALSEHRP